MGEKGIMIMGHGSTMAFNKAVMDLHAGILREKGFENVHIGYNEFSYPSISDKLEEMASAGIDDIVCLPFFIASGLHMTRDIPAKLGIPPLASDAVSDVRGRKVRIRFEEPFGKDPVLTDILRSKAEELDEGIDGAALLVMSHGSKLPHNMEIAEHHAAELRKAGYRAYVAYNELNSPTIEESVEAMLADGARHIIALPLFMAMGKHLVADIPPRIRLQGADQRRGSFIHGGREVAVSYAHPVGSDRRLSDILERKIRAHFG
ncbi:MAG: sirohydrochlorin cobaltochelatase [Candidatus Methanoplasma sp.]|jgi:sirohydrochlorin cobaltochelatase|nr:sirohydrochlorin cobaltochelatase [Candidatus Methanoplasma sp.]